MVVLVVCVEMQWVVRVRCVGDAGGVCMCEWTVVGYGLQQDLQRFETQAFWLAAGTPTLANLMPFCTEVLLRVRVICCCHSLLLLSDS